jgi:hypothetical protein
MDLSSDNFKLYGDKHVNWLLIDHVEGSREHQYQRIALVAVMMESKRRIRPQFFTKPKYPKIRRLLYNWELLFLAYEAAYHWLEDPVLEELRQRNPKLDGVHRLIKSNMKILEIAIYSHIAGESKSFN